ncbi:MAG: anaerobic ribonucleoside-triphosphate reductase activating protein [Fibrobacter sp.]|jgi:pyruvate formate lyase activating enzyme|nr:anaerobic ribonucleoside-triphosphate reductase activating protein [Fibrobacter sp.]
MSGGFKGIIGWQKTSFIDYPGTVSTVLFFEGCNLRCPYCHNPDIVLRKLPQIPWTSVQSFLLRRKKMMEGVVLSGGEPTLHAILPDLVREIRESGFKIKIDTNGTDPEMISRCEPDYLALDVKTDPLRYAELGCKDPEFGKKLRNAIEIVKTMGSSAEVRITMASPFISEDVVHRIAELLTGVQKVFLQPLKLTGAVLDSSLGPQNVIPAEQIRSFREMIAPFTGSCIVRGE